MRQPNGVYTQRFNRHHKRMGHVFQGRYKAVIVQKVTYLLELARYIVLNSVRAHMVDSAGEWPWSSYQVTIGEAVCPAWLRTEWLLSAFARSHSSARDTYRRYVSEGQGHPAPWKELKSRIYLEASSFIEKMQTQLEADKAKGKI